MCSCVKVWGNSPTTGSCGFTSKNSSTSAAASCLKRTIKEDSTRPNITRESNINLFSGVLELHHDNDDDDDDDDDIKRKNKLVPEVYW